MHKVRIENRIFLASDGEKLSDVLLRASLFVPHPCAGRGTCKKCTVTIDGREHLSCQYRVYSDISVVLPTQTAIASETGATVSAVQADKGSLVLDIGTTTLAMAVVATDEKKAVRVITRTNPQIAFGADVISRIDYCRQNGVKPLFDAVTGEINRMIAALEAPMADTLYVAGNTTMLHCFLCEDCSSMGVHPYTPAFLESKTVDAQTLSIVGVRKIVTLPNISAFVGADLVAGLNVTTQPSDGKYSLLVDLGTNAEVVLFSETDILCTAAAAGPCFEGANISQGMPATAGAICAYSLANGVPTIKTIDNAPAKGICGTGLVDIIAELVQCGTIDETGFMEDESFEVAPGVFLEQGDIRQFQLAKSAVYSAIFALLHQKNITCADVQTLYIAGGFSAQINIRNAVAVGLLPKELAERCVPLNNSSLLGTVRYVCEQNDLSQFVNKASYVDLAADKIFSELFVENMLFE